MVASKLRLVVLVGVLGLLVACAATASPYYDAVMGDNPVAYWRLNETSGAKVYDKVSSREGDIIGGVTLNQPSGLANHPADPSMNFRTIAASNGKIDVPQDAALNPNVFSIECWTRVLGGTGHRSPITSRTPITGGGSAGYIIYADPGGEWEFWTGTGPGTGWHALAGTVDVVPGMWTHLVATFDGTTKSLYVNGKLANSGGGGYYPNTTAPLRIGAGQSEGSGAYWFYGDIDEVAVYDKALSPERIQAHYLTGVPEPATLTLLAAGGLALLRRRRRSNLRFPK